jgi:hypothetical protein
MTDKLKLYTGLMIIGLAVTGTGLWFVFNPSSAAVIEIQAHKAPGMPGESAPDRKV